MKKTYICIACPMGCPMTLDATNPADLLVEGNKCPRGRSYAIEEHSDPKRVVTTTVQTASPAYPRIPVKTDRAIRKQLVDDLLHHLHSLEIKLPVKRGDILVSDFKDTGVQVLITRSFS